MNLWKLSSLWTSRWLPDFKCTRLFFQMILLHSLLPCFTIFFQLNLHGPIHSSIVGETLNFALKKSVTTEHFRTALLLSVIVAIPLAVDVILDLALTIDRYDEQLHLYTRAIILAAMVGPNLLLLSVDFGNSVADVYMYSFFFFRVASVMCSLVYLIEITSSLRNSRTVSYILVISLLFAVDCAANEADLMYNLSYHSFLGMMSSALYLLIGVVTISCGHDLFTNGIPPCMWRNVQPVELTVLTYAVSLGIMNISFIKISQHYGAISKLNASSDCICMHTYIQMAFTVMVITLQSRITRIEAVKQSRFVKERQAFIRYISHEIRTPLNTVFLGLEFVTSELMKWNSPKQENQVLPLVETVNDIRSSCQISLSILDDLLTFDKMEAGKMTLELKYLNCCAFIAAVAKPFKVNARERGISFNFHRDLVLVDNACTGCLHIDSSKMGQVLRNLISNALKFTPSGGTVTISLQYVANPTDEDSGVHPLVDADDVESTCSNQLLRIEVSDSGVGISETDQCRLFGQYVQFNANKLQKGNGSGLGLWISKGITKLHGGHIGAYSKGEGFGSTFFLELPVFFDVTDEGDGDAESHHVQSSFDRAFSSRTEEDPPQKPSVIIESVAPSPRRIQSRDSHSSSTPFLTPTSHMTPVNSSVCSPSLSAICSSVDTKDSKDGCLVSSALNKTDDFLSSADHFMVTSTPHSRGSIGTVRSARGIERTESNGGLRTSGKCTPGALTSIGFRKASKVHQDHSSVWAQRSGSITSELGTSLRGSKCVSPPTGTHLSDSSRHSILESIDSCKAFSGMIPDHLQSALEAIVAMSFLDGDVESETVSMNSSHMLARRTCSALTDETTQDQSVQSTSNSRNGKALDECYSSQLSARPQLSTVAEHNHSVSEKKGLSYNPNVVDSEVAPRLVLPAHPLRFLIVDDSAMNRRMLRRLLSTHNYYIVEATDGKDCLKVWTDSASMGNAIDVVLIDNIMPTMSGPEAAKEMRARGFPGLIIGVTGHCLKEDIDNFVKCGANAVLSKPLNFVEMNTLVQELMLVGLSSGH